MANLQDTTPPIEPHEPTSTSIQEPTPASNLTAASQGSQAAESDSKLAYKLIGTTELCEQILGYLSCTELSRAKRVCRTFRDVIDCSLMLQRHLFLALWTEALPEVVMKADEEWHILYDFHTILATEAPPNPQSDFQIQLQPVLKHGNWLYFTGPFSTLNQLTQTFENVSGVSDHSCLRKMFLSNPPVKQIRTTYCNTSPQYARRDRISKLSRILCSDTLSSDKGITFGQVFDWAEKTIGKQLKGASVRRVNYSALLKLGTMSHCV
jgi:hypothetical protein